MEQNGIVHGLVVKKIKIDTDENIFEIDGKSFVTECDNFVLVMTALGFELFINANLSELNFKEWI